MKTYKKVQVAFERTQIDRMSCELCGRTVEAEDWGENCYDVASVEIKCKEGSQYPEGSWGEIIETDICPECFRSKIMPALETIGVKFRTVEYD